MSRMVDVVVPVYRNVTLTRACIESVLWHSEGLGRLIVINDRGPELEMQPMLEGLRRADSRVSLLVNEQNRGFVSSANRGMFVRHPGRDVVILNSDTEVTAGWLTELSEVGHSAPDIAAVGPLSNSGGLSSVPELDHDFPADALRDVDLQLEALPRHTAMPTLMGFCLLLRDDALRAIGGFDPIFGRGYNEENDWCCRARARGYRVVRANRAFVFHLGGASFGQERNTLERANARVLWARYPTYLRETSQFRSTPEAKRAADHVRERLALCGRPALDTGVPSR